jgi:hypothetical protein
VVETGGVTPNTKIFFDDFVDLWVDGCRGVVVEIVSHGVIANPGLGERKKV